MAIDDARPLGDGHNLLSRNPFDGLNPHSLRADRCARVERIPSCVGGEQQRLQLFEPREYFMNLRGGSFVEVS